MALKHWIIGGSIVASTVASALWGVPRTAGGVGKFFWSGALSQPQAYVELDYTLKNGNKLHFEVPEESQPTLANFLATRTGDVDEIGLELIAADADDGAADGLFVKDSVAKLAHGYFTNRAKDYKAGNMPMQEIFKNAKPAYAAPATPAKPGDYEFKKK